MAFIKFKPLTAELNYSNLLTDLKNIEEIQDFLLDGEELKFAAKATRDLFIVSDKRIIIIDLKGIRGFRKAIYTFAYKNITAFSIEVQNLDTKMVLNMNNGYNVEVKFSKPITLDEMYNIYNYISNKIIV